jgi:hypothetical protein
MPIIEPTADLPATQADPFFITFGDTVITELTQGDIDSVTINAAQGQLMTVAIEGLDPAEA